MRRSVHHIDSGVLPSVCTAALGPSLCAQRCPFLTFRKSAGPGLPSSPVPVLSSEHCRAGDPGLIFGKGSLMELLAKPDVLSFGLQTQGLTASESWFSGVMGEGSFHPRLCFSFSPASKFDCFSLFHQSPQDRMKSPRKESLVAASSSIVGDENLWLNI